MGLEYDEERLLHTVKYYQARPCAERMLPVYEKVQRLIAKIANGLSRATGAEFDDLAQEGFLALYGALANYRVDQGDFSKFFAKAAKGEMLRYIGNTGNTIRIPLAMQGRIHAYKKAMAEAEQIGIREEHALDLFLMQRIGISEAELETLRTALEALEIRSLDDTMLPDAEETRLDTLAAPDNTQKAVEDEYQRELSEVLRKEVRACGELHERVLTDQYWREKSAKACAAEMGCTEKRILSLRAGALQKLRKGDVRRRLEQFVSDAEVFSLGLHRQGAGACFKRTGSSVTESAALRIMEMERVRSQADTMEQIGENIKKNHQMTKFSP